MPNWRKKSSYVGALAIGDPHVEGRQPGFRCDDYPVVILEKIQWCLDYARGNGLLPILLGDFFDKPRDNPTWMLGRLIEMMRNERIIGIYGNHDCAETELTENDSLSILIKAGCLQMVSADRLWRGYMNERPVVIGGSSYREPIPDSVALPPRGDLFDTEPLVIWLAHHDIAMPDYDGLARIQPGEIENVDLLINGHIHKKLAPVRHGRTLWVTPGNISRRTRSEATQSHKPSALRIDVTAESCELSQIEIPHSPFERVFHQAILDGTREFGESAFVRGLGELQARRTASGAGLHEFLNQNLEQFDDRVAHEIMQLAKEVTERS